jgi:hypothetical protein
VVPGAAAAGFKHQPFEGDTALGEWAKKVDQYVLGIKEDTLWGNTAKSQIIDYSRGLGQVPIMNSAFDFVKCFVQSITAPLFVAMQIMLPSGVGERETVTICLFASLTHIPANVSSRDIECASQPSSCSAQ